MNKAKLIAACALLTTLCAPAFSNVSLGNTRLVVNEQDQSTPISVNNTGSTPLLIQSWVSAEDKSVKAPFIVTPPLFRLESKQENTLRVLHLPGTLPQDQESLFWLNVKEIPPVDKSLEGKNVLRIAINNRIKLFYRPNGLDGNADAAPQNIAWQLSHTPSGQWQLVAHNPSPYHITFSSVKFNGQRLSASGMLKPRGELAFMLKGASQDNQPVEFTTINDYGGNSHFQGKATMHTEPKVAP